MPEVTAQTTAILTIGYGGRTLDDFLRLLRSHGVQYVIDVRSVPGSRHRPEFCGDPLRMCYATTA